MPRSANEARLGFKAWITDRLREKANIYKQTEGLRQTYLDDEESGSGARSWPREPEDAESGASGVFPTWSFASRRFAPPSRFLG